MVFFLKKTDVTPTLWQRQTGTGNMAFTLLEMEAVAFPRGANSFLLKVAGCFCRAWPNQHRSITNHDHNLLTGVICETPSLIF